MFDAAVLALRVLPDGDQVDVGVRRLVALDGDAGPHVGVEVEGLPEQQVHGGVSGGDGGLQGSCRTEAVSRGATRRKRAAPHQQTFEADLAPVHRLLSIRGDHPPAPGALDGRDVPLLPPDGSLQTNTTQILLGFAETSSCAHSLWPPQRSS